MTVRFHPAVQGDYNLALSHYETEGGPHLADRFEGGVPGVYCGHSSRTPAIWILPQERPFPAHPIGEFSLHHRLSRKWPNGPGDGIEA